MNIQKILFFKNCLAEVYVGLSDEEALRLSQWHNQTSHFVHNVTHRDLVGLHMYYPCMCVCTYVTVSAKTVPIGTTIEIHFMA